jgi:predicted HAD superfamily phosphohydrolase
LRLVEIAAIATIITAIIVVIQFFSRRGNPSLPVIPDEVKAETKKLNLNLDDEIYEKEYRWLSMMYKTAIKLPHSSDKSDALIKVARAAIGVNDFNMAIISANAIPYSQNKAETLMEIVTAATNDKQYYAYALASAEKIPYSREKGAALKIIIDLFEVESKKATEDISIETK